MEDEFDDDADFSAALEAAERRSKPASNMRVDAANKPTTNATVQQPKPQALPGRAAPSAILVSPKQKGNPVLNSIRALPWEYSDILPDYVLGATTCALFLSLKYHRLHPEYIYNRIRDLKGQYNLRVVLTMVDIETHEEPLKELSKTSLINNVTIILCWSAQECGRYLELFKSFENAAPTSIRTHQSTSYSDRIEEFITVPRGINKTDAMSLVSSFGSIRTAVNASPEEILMVAGWGEKKVQRWCNTVREPFRIRKAAKRGPTRDDTRPSISRESTRVGSPQKIDEQAQAVRLGIASIVPIVHTAVESSAVRDLESENARSHNERDPDDDEELALLEASGYLAPIAQSKASTSSVKASSSSVSEGIAAALARLRKES